MIALFVARLQPFHLGHLHAIKKILEKYDFILIAIGSSNASRQRPNPFSFEERKSMLIKVLTRENLIYRCKIVGVPDMADDEWTGEIKQYEFDVVVTGNDWTKKCLRGDYEITEPDFLEPAKYNATRIRNIIRLRGSWDFLVPEEVYEFVINKLKNGDVKIDGPVETSSEW